MATTARGARTGTTVTALALAGLAVAGMTVAAGTVATPARAASPRCSAVQMLVAPGTGETSTSADPARSHGTLAAVSDPLDARFGPARLRVSYVPYPATALERNAPLYFDSERTGVRRTVQMINQTRRRCPQTRFLLLGYSQGADVVGDVGNRIGIGNGPVEPSALLGVGLLAGPQYDRDVGIRPGPPIDTDGVLGAREEAFGSVARRVVQVCAPKDWVCDPNSRSVPALIRQRRNGVHGSYDTFQVRPGVTGLDALTRYARRAVEAATR